MFSTRKGVIRWLGVRTGGVAGVRICRVWEMSTFGCWKQGVRFRNAFEWSEPFGTTYHTMRGVHRNGGRGRDWEGQTGCLRKNFVKRKLFSQFAVGRRPWIPQSKFYAKETFSNFVDGGGGASPLDPPDKIL